jgi:hypothetical protein
MKRLTGPLVLIHHFCFSGKRTYSGCFSSDISMYCNFDELEKLFDSIFI